MHVACLMAFFVYLHTRTSFRLVQFYFECLCIIQAILLANIRIMHTMKVILCQMDFAVASECSALCIYMQTYYIMLTAAYYKIIMWCDNFQDVKKAILMHIQICTSIFQHQKASLTKMIVLSEYFALCKGVCFMRALYIT